MYVPGGVVAASEAANPPVSPVIIPATVVRTFFVVEEFLVRIIGTAAPIMPPAPTIIRDNVLLFLMSSYEESSITNF